MTHDELLAKIDKGYLSIVDDSFYYKFALIAVVELHSPDEIADCAYCGYAYPCTTIQAIEKELK